MIPQTLYTDYLEHLLEGQRAECTRIVQSLLEAKIDIKELYVDLFQKSLYEVKPDLVGLSLSVHFNMPALIKGIEAVKSEFKDIDLAVGGQAFNWGGVDTVKDYANTVCIRSLAELETMITV